MNGNLIRVLGIIQSYWRAVRYTLTTINHIKDAGKILWPFIARIKYGIGAKSFALFDLAKKPRATWSDYIIDEEFKKIVRNISPPEARIIADNKFVFYEHCVKHHIETIPIIAIFTNNEKNKLSDITTIEVSSDFKTVLGDGSFFAKKLAGSHGEGAFSFEVKDSNVYWQQKKGSLQEFFAFCSASIGCNETLIFQPKISNHCKIRELTAAKGLSTIRIITTYNNGNFSIVGACFRILVNDSDVDNFSHGMSGNLTAAVAIDTGILFAARGSSSSVWPIMMDVSIHPKSKVHIVGFELPLWKECITTVQNAHIALKELKTVGWDIAITESGIKVVEANWRYDVDIAQVSYKKGFKPILYPKLDIHN